MELTIECQKRAPGSKAGALRREGRMPAVLYGHQGAESVSLTLDAKDAETLVRKASLNNTLIQVKIPDLPWSGKALLREVQTHPWRRSIYHISFFSIAAQSSVEVTVPINFVGEAVGVRMGGGALDTVLTELQVQCDPEAIPETIEVDVTDFQVGDSIHVNELKLPKGVEAVGEPDRVVVSVLAGRTSSDDDADETASASE
ncbi:50S ribosomal protein L25/general stress protein Ctc [Oculatella sp. FACHB-28]|uniref:50S ribosomal protein L25/general stress protein Ctc n=1 Tax=Cyanophyceae TaxID=3028117 RepID=UPI0016897AC4|nr:MULTISPECIES: 50S ribosomal protein L25/general stress protein Ctc [Cyanophyceae]MBD1867031.1 50S ribosomal protein L25/general stress protein Ctc [Cyanobacteria bacterium FACHB-471]MBD1999161.1 50S ribosomal protein L25/general stress protein Ctc [Leptolyngbya sp. FACHB-541]MBD2057915.1 50S ribosomal protein L25/general stress protein Ctc [Oculatella sp. FACHB-28]MBD2070861.1 50S ribosomal protein L25/general stress protein Ctc [Leptolyngbya sp. FACHB-671]